MVNFYITEHKLTNFEITVIFSLIAILVEIEINNELKQK